MITHIGQKMEILGPCCETKFCGRDMYRRLAGSETVRRVKSGLGRSKTTEHAEGKKARAGTAGIMADALITPPQRQWLGRDRQRITTRRLWSDSWKGPRRVLLHSRLSQVRFERGRIIPRCNRLRGDWHHKPRSAARQNIKKA